MSVHNFLGLYSEKGYPAVGIFGPKTINNIFEAEMSWWPSGEYRDSVENGIEELSGYVKDQIKDCPDQLLVLGGYSQGAHVVGDSLFKFTEFEQGRVNAVALFGDPKYLGSSADNNTPIDYLTKPGSKPVAKPWKRGTASLIDRGILDSRAPYLPANLENKTISWCFNDDFVCSGGSGILQSARPITLQQTSSLNKDELGAGHKRYVGYGAPEAAQEIVQRLSPRLYNINALKGGVDIDKGLEQNLPTIPNDKPIDIMFMINTSAGVDDVLGQMRSNSLSILPPFYAYYSNIAYGVGEYSEVGEITERIPRSIIWQQPTLNFETFDKSVNRKLAYGGQSGGGLDLSDPHQLGIEKAIRAAKWREGAERHVVLITERPMSSSISFNFCDSRAITGFNYDNNATCTDEPSDFNKSTALHSERCKQIYEIVTQAKCEVALPSSGRYQVTRNESSLNELIETSSVAVSIVVPHGFKSGTSEESARLKLSQIAQSSGGLFLEYPEFNRANYSNLVWRVLNNKFERKKLSAIQDFDSVNSTYGSVSGEPLQFFTNSPLLFNLDITNVFNSYAWDLDGDGIVDETTYTPQLEHIYTSPITGKYFSVTAISSAGSITSKTPLSVIDSDSVFFGIKPTDPVVSADRELNGEVNIKWTCSDGDVFMIDLDTDRHPDYSAPCSKKSATFLSLSSSYFLAWAENFISKSNVMRVDIKEKPEAQENTNSDSNDPPSTDNSKGAIKNEGIETGDDVKYQNNLNIITGEFIKMLQQSQPQSTGNNTETYNPQKTQSNSQKSSQTEQQAGALKTGSLANEFEPKPEMVNVDASSTATYLFFLVFLPLIRIIYMLRKTARK